MGTQVDLLTRDKAGNLKTDHQREFIDFRFDGKYISEFGMVAGFDGDRHSFNASSDFEDEVSSVNGVDGQYYWGTRIKPLTMSFELATDGMTEVQVNDFKQHFKPGKYGEFVESKLACRYGYCRISQVVNFSVIPFIKKETIFGKTIEVNEYKGSAKITFIFDEPYFYAFEPERIFSKSIDEMTDDEMRAMVINNIPVQDQRAANADVEVGYYNKYLTILEQPPEFISANKGEAITLSVTVEETELVKKYELQYRYTEKNSWSPIGITSNSYTFIAKESSDCSQYRYKIVDIYGNDIYTTPTTIAVPYIIRIKSQSGGRTAYAGDTVTFNVKVDSTYKVKQYVWEYKSTSSSQTWNRIRTVTKDSLEDNLVLYNVTTSMNGRMYRATVTDVQGNSAVSNTMHLTVRPNPGDGGPENDLNPLTYNLTNPANEPALADVTPFTELKYYNPSTAPTKTKITLKQIYQTSNGYIAGIGDNYNSSKFPYNEIKLFNNEILISSFRYTTPSVINSINKAIFLAANYDDTHTTKIALDVEDLLRENITHSKVLAWITNVLNILKMDTDIYDKVKDCFGENWLSKFKQYMYYFLSSRTEKENISEPANVFEKYEWGSLSDTTIIFDGINSKTTVVYNYNSIEGEEIKSYTTEEECGDMILTPYLKLEGGDSLDLINKAILNTNHMLRFYSCNNSISILPQHFILDYKYTYL